MVKKLKKSALDLTTAGLTIGVGAGLIGAAGGNPGAITPLSRALPVVGTIAGGGIVVGQLRELNKSTKRKK